MEERDTSFLITRELGTLVGSRTDQPVVIKSAINLLARHHLSFNEMGGDPEDPLLTPSDIKPINLADSYRSIP